LEDYHMDTILILGTKQGVIAAYKLGNSWIKAGHSLENQRVTSITTSNGRVLAGTTSGMFRSFIGSPNKNHLEAVISKIEWEPLQGEIASVHFRYLATYPGTAERILAGAEPAEIYLSQDGGITWRNSPEVADLRQRFGWSLPYSPEDGCVRGFAFQGKRAYAAVEDGCVLISDDNGETWRLAEGSAGDPDHSPRKGFIHSDVHSIEAHPSASELVIAPTGGGLYLSKDGGVTWSNIYRCYTRAAWLNPEDTEHVIFGPAMSVDRGGRIEMTKDSGRIWAKASQGLDAPWNSYMVERFIQVGEDLLAVLSNGKLAITNLDNMEWKFILPDIPFVLAAAWMAVDEKAG
jgi:hypothetical protein